MRFGGLIAAVVFAAIAAVVVLRMSAGSAPAPTMNAPAPEAKSVNIYVATKPLPVGTTITDSDIGVQPWPEHLMLDNFVQADGKMPIVGMVTRASIQQSEPITTSKVANPNDPNFLAGDLPKGMRVVTIPVNETDGVAGFVFPGDHVDLIYTHDVPKWEFPPSAGAGQSKAERSMVTVTETLLTNVKVVAIDQRSSGAGAVDNKGNLIVPRAASLMVSGPDSQRVRLATKTGTLSLVLRALADKESADPLVLTEEKDISQAKLGSGGGDNSQGDVVKIVRGAPVDNKETSDAAAIARGAAQGNGTAIGAGVPNPNLVPLNNNNITTPSAAY